MGSEYVIGLDLGTSGLKLVLLDREGKVRGSSFESYPVIYPKPAWAEQDPRDWDAAVINGIRGLASKAHVSPHEICAIGISSQIDGVVPIGDDGRPLRNAIIWMDRRAKRQCDQIRSLIGEEEHYSLTGLSIDPSHTAPKILWLRDNEPQIYEDTKRFLLPGNYVFHLLTHHFRTDHSNASCTMLYEIGHQDWSKRMCDLLKISIDTLPELRNSTDASANIVASIAEKCGLRGDVRVAVGGGDEEIGAVGAGVIDDHALLDLTGTSEPMCLSLNEPVLDPTRLLECHAHGYPGKWLLENTGGLAGGIYRWFNDQFGLAESIEARKANVDSYEMLNREIASVAAGSEGLLFLPFLSGSILPEWNPNARGAFLGITLSHTRQHFARAIMEGTAYVLKDIIVHLEKIGHEPTRIVFAGGGARAEVWRQIKTDVINRNTKRCVTEEVTALGAAIVGAVAAGFYGSIDEAVEKTVRTHSELRPSRKEAETYEQMYGLYREAYESLRNIFGKLAAVQGSE